MKEWLLEKSLQIMTSGILFDKDWKPLECGDRVHLMDGRLSFRQSGSGLELRHQNSPFNNLNVYPS